ncbi:hypothetical protein J3E64_000580 [Sphingobium sp. OAS761]|uniref:hypothetical protein n=1 Tax=Sphingobium sp. OAS761 TaxID=2817901 RepID=UPI00209F35E9|nr:hypothetical protein [Sphingobium sp. OAS761]MCP1468909.1 hypothetical protein [Sphingobium sp. OAS761]
MTSLHPSAARENLLQSQPIGRRRSDPLPRLLVQLLARAGAPATVDRATSRPWASALFEGRRHVVRLLLGGPDSAARAARFADGLGSVEWALSGQFVADISLDNQGCDEGGQWLDLSILTIEDW